LKIIYLVPLPFLFLMLQRSSDFASLAHSGPDCADCVVWAHLPTHLSVRRGRTRGADCIPTYLPTHLSVRRGRTRGADCIPTYPPICQAWPHPWC
jgi:hypothetical protein